MTPTLSIVIPVHNQASRLRLTLASLEHQTDVPPGAFEVIVVDDNSSDHVADVIADQRARGAYPLAGHRCRSGGARGVPRNLGIDEARGDRILFLDADAMSGRALVAQHLAAHGRKDRVAVGEMYVLPGTEYLRDPSDVLPLDDVRRGLEDAELLPHAAKGVYPGQACWQVQLEEAITHGEQLLASLAVIPHNLSIERDTVRRLGGFDSSLPHLEGWELGLRAIHAGATIGFARGARSFHLYHARSGSEIASHIDQAASAIKRRFPDVAVDLLLLWIAACAGDSLIPPEYGLGDWRSLTRLLADPAMRADAERLCRLRARVVAPVEPLEYRWRSALDRPIALSRLHASFTPRSS